MRRYYLDTNVVLDFLADRKPFSEDAAGLFDAALSGEIILYVGTISFNNIYYVLRKVIGHEEALVLVRQVMELIEIADVTGQVIRRAVLANFHDFEDAIQYHTALELPQVDAIVTRNAKDFRKSSLPILSPAEALAAI